MEKLIFKLQQHTPLVHFQPDLKNSTLRASEVKPGLDRFIIKKNGGFKKLKEIHPDWFIRNADFPALNYKMKIIQKTDVGRIKLNPNYFGDKNKNLVFGEGQVECTLNLFSSSLLKIISKEVLMEFFLHNNFGCRKSKGSGSYTLSKYNNEDITIKENLDFLKRKSNDSIFNEYLRFEIDDDDQKDINKSKVFSVINYYWKRLKSGINYTYDYNVTKSIEGEYKPAFLKEYINNNIKNYRWEKRWLKEKFMGLPSLPRDKKPKFARALLGLPSNYIFLDASSLKKYSQSENKIAPSYSLKLNVKSKSGIDRIPSPIIFKPILEDSSCSVFLIIDKSYEKWDIIDKSFSFINGNVKLDLKTPDDKLIIGELIKEYNNSIGNDSRKFEAKSFKDEKRQEIVIIASIEILPI